MAKRHCMNCGGKMKFYAISATEPLSKPYGNVLKLRWYKCTQCDYKEWVMCRKE